MKMRSLALSICSAAILVGAEARADVVEDNAATMTIVGLGVVGGIATSIAAIVYAVDDRSFDSPWIVASLFSAAVCGAMTVALIADTAGGTGDKTTSVLSIFALVPATIWPTFWTVRTAIADVEPGERFDTYEPEELEEEARRDTRGALIVPAFAITF
jgi:hypothetical protein